MTVVQKHCDHVATEPSGVVLQSNARQRASISPRPANRSASRIPAAGDRTPPPTRSVMIAAGCDCSLLRHSNPRASRILHSRQQHAAPSSTDESSGSVYLQSAHRQTSRSRRQAPRQQLAPPAAPLTCSLPTRGGCRSSGATPNRRLGGKAVEPRREAVVARRRPARHFRRQGIVVAAILGTLVCIWTRTGVVVVSKARRPSSRTN
jgi:hypothetical protein